MNEDRRRPKLGQAKARVNYAPREPPMFGIACSDESEDDEPRQRGPAPSTPIKPSNEADAWAVHADALAVWTLKRLVNRTDAWVQYLALEQRRKQNARTIKGELTKKVLLPHYKGTDVSDLIALHTTSQDNLSRSLGFDIDWHGEPDPEKQRQNRKAAKKLYKRAKRLGFDPLLIDSNGRGGYHLILIFQRSVPTTKVYAFGQWLLKDWQQLGFAEKPEQFPKQPFLDKNTPYGNALRLPGRHHKHDWYSRVWTGEQWAKGEEAIRIILGTKGAQPELIPVDAAAINSKPASAESGPARVIAPEMVDEVQRRALALLNKKLTAVQGNGGDKATWTAALYLVKDFALSVEQALPVLKQWNSTNCNPRWGDEDLLRKLRRAEQEPGARGRLVTGSLVSVGNALPGQALEGTSFLIDVPDFIRVDWQTFRPLSLPRKRGRFDPASVWRLCRRYERQGLAAVTLIATPAPKEPETSTTPTEVVAAGVA